MACRLDLLGLLQRQLEPLLRQALGEADRQRIVREVKRVRGFVPVTVRENLNWTDVARIEVNAPDLPGVRIEVGQTREYPFSDDAAHILGYVAAVSEKELDGDPLLELPGFRIGKSGIERTAEEALRGKAGSKRSFDPTFSGAA